MKPQQTDRTIVIVMASAQMVWAACLSVLWCAALDTSPTSWLLTVSGTLLAVAMTMSLPGRLVRLVQRVLAAMGVQDVLVMEMAQARDRVGRQDLRAIARIVAMACVGAIILGAISTAAIWTGGRAVDWLSQRVLLGGAGWMGLRLMVATVGMLPMGLGISVTFLAGAIFRAGGASDFLGPICRDWLWSATVGSAVLGGALLAGANLLALAMTMAVFLAAAGAGAFMRREMTPRPAGQVISPSPPHKAQLAVLCGFGAMGVAMLVQWRMAADLLAVGAAGAALWTAASAAMLAAFVSKADARSNPPGPVQTLAGIMGVACGLLMQAVLAGLAAAAMCRGDRAGGAVLAGLAAAGQIPLAALGGILISRQRRQFAAAGGQARSYMAAASLGTSIGVLAYMACMTSLAGHLALLSVGVFLPAWAGIACIRRSGRPGGQAFWATMTTLMVASLAAAALSSAAGLRQWAPSVSVGAFLSGADRTGEGPAVLELSRPPRWRCPAVSQAVDDWLETAGRGRWLAAGMSKSDWAPLTRAGMSVQALWLDAPPWDASDFLSAVRIGVDRGDGLFVAGLPAGHRQAWRFYNPQTLSRCRTLLHAGAPMLLRLQAGADEVPAVLAVAKGFNQACGPGFAMIAFRGDDFDMLLGGPMLPVHIPQSAPLLDPSRVQEVHVVPLGRLIDDWPEIRPMDPAHPSPGLLGPRIEPRQLRTYLRDLAD